MNTLVMADLHLGSGRSLAVNPELLERLEPELRWAQRLVILGDLIHTVPLARALQAAGSFGDLVAWHVAEVVLVPGNHEYWLLASGRRRAQLEPGRDPLADCNALLQRLFPGTRVATHYPWLRLEGLQLLHGHQLLSRLMAGHALQPEQYDQPLEVLSDACWALRQHYRDVDSPAIASLLQAMGRISTPGSGRTRSLVEVLELMAEVVAELGLRPGPVVFAHLHQQIQEWAVGDYAFSNPGAWVLDPFVRDHDPDPVSAHPGGVLRLSEKGMQHRRLLDELSWRQLEQLSA